MPHIRYGKGGGGVVIKTKPSRRPAAKLETSKAIQVFVSEDGDVSSTASTIIEDIFDNEPIPIGVLDADGDMLFRYPYKDTVPLGFHYTAEEHARFYAEYGYDYTSTEDADEDEDEDA